MTAEYEQALRELNDLQRTAAEWDENAALILAGPGSGKTRVLTTRIARLLYASPDKNFRILALTFTNKAADEMTGRLNTLSPGTEARLFIGTFHSFCTHLLRQHGAHIGIQSNFTIYSQDDDRKHVLRDARKREPKLPSVGHDEQRILKNLDSLMNAFATPQTTLSYFKDQALGEWYATVYQRYEEELNRLNALDFNSLLVQAFRLITHYPAIAQRYQRTYPFWLIDEFQDTNTAQYRLIKALATTAFKNIFVVADDDQIIYEWNGASYQQLERFRNDFAPALIQLPTNYRCPATIVSAANQLVTNNSARTRNKAPLVAARTTTQFPAREHIRVLSFTTDVEEADGVASCIHQAGDTTWGKTVVLARARALLDNVLQALKDRGVPAVLAQRRDQFLTPHFQWLQLCLRQVVRPGDKSNFTLLVNAHNKMAGIECSPNDLMLDAEQTGADYLSVWASTLTNQGASVLRTTGEYANALLLQPERHVAFASYFETAFRAQCTDDAALIDDCTAWQELRISIAQSVGRDAGLDQFLQQLDLRSKEPSPPPDTVRLMTIHAAKGTEADHVYVIGMAEGLIPSFQSIKEGDQSPQMEEERRNCFVAITRTKEQLTLSTAGSYKGWTKRPSRFLAEMGLTITPVLTATHN